MTQLNQFLLKSHQTLSKPSEIDGSCQVVYLLPVSFRRFTTKAQGFSLHGLHLLYTAFTLFRKVLLQIHISQIFNTPNYVIARNNST